MATIPTITRWFKAITGSSLSITEKTQARSDIDAAKSSVLPDSTVTRWFNAITGTALSGTEKTNARGDIEAAKDSVLQDQTVNHWFKAITGDTLSDPQKVDALNSIGAAVASVIEDYISPQTLTISAGVATLTAGSQPNANLLMTSDASLQIIPSTAGQSGTIRVTQSGGPWSLTNSGGYPVSNGDIADVASVTASGEIIITWFSHDGTNVTLFIGSAS